MELRMKPNSTHLPSKAQCSTFSTTKKGGVLEAHVWLGTMTWHERQQGRLESHLPRCRVEGKAVMPQGQTH